LNTVFYWNVKLAIGDKDAEGFKNKNAFKNSNAMREERT
jgi:hypothetical protein